MCRCVSSLSQNPSLGTITALEVEVNRVVCIALFVFSISDLKQNARSLLTQVSDPAFYALLHGSLGFALHGSFYNRFLIGQNSSTANQNL